MTQMKIKFKLIKQLLPATFLIRVPQITFSIKSFSVSCTKIGLQTSIFNDEYAFETDCFVKHPHASNLRSSSIFCCVSNSRNLWYELLFIWIGNFKPFNRLDFHRFRKLCKRRTAFSESFNVFRALVLVIPTVNRKIKCKTKILLE